LADLDTRLLQGQKPVDRVLDRGPLGSRAGLLAGVQRVLLFQVLRQGRVGVSPRPEIVEFAADLLGPVPGRVREEREFGAWFRGLARPGGWCRMALGHGDELLTPVTVFLAGTVTTPRPLP